MFVYVYKAVYSLLVYLLLCPALFGQSVSSSLRFDTESWDFGRIKESGGSVFHTFNFVNTSSKTLQFGRVSPSCSCVSAIFTQDSFESHEMGEIIVRFNPAGALGKVSRYVDLYAADGTHLVSLSLTADVISERQNIAQPFLYKISNQVSADRDQINIGYIPLGGYASESVSYKHIFKTVKLLVRPRDQSSFLIVTTLLRLLPEKQHLLKSLFQFLTVRIAMESKRD
jgi:hypothetical protein